MDCHYQIYLMQKSYPSKSVWNWSQQVGKGDLMAIGQAWESGFLGSWSYTSADLPSLILVLQVNGAFHAQLAVVEG